MASLTNGFVNFLAVNRAAGVVATLPAAFFMKRFGRRAGFMLGAGLGMLVLVQRVMEPEGFFEQVGVKRRGVLHVRHRGAVLGDTLPSETQEREDA